MIHSSERAANFVYAIRNVVRAAEALERQGRRVIYLNIGDPQSFGFHPPDFVIEAVNRAVKDKFLLVGVFIRQPTLFCAQKLAGPFSESEIRLPDDLR